MDTKKLRQKILDLAIHGKLVPQDPNDEPASVLLERIKAEKERLIKEGKIKKSKKSAKTSDTPHYENVPFEVPDNWVWTTLGNIGTWQAGGTPSRSNKSYYGGNIPWLKTGDLNDGLITNIPEKITEDAVANSSAKINPTGSVLIAMYGATIGKLGILTFPATTNQACCACIECFAITQKYLFYFLLSHRDMFIAKGGGGAQPNISKEIIVNTAIPLPPLAEQERIVTEIERRFTLIDQLEQGKSDLQTVIKQAKSRVLYLAIHGKLVPQNPNDEPAIKLLKRINPDFAPCDNGHSEKLPQGWCHCMYKNIFSDISSKPYQILQSQITCNGTYPVISQSANFIEGYSSENRAFQHERPCIIFGDHTRNVKYVDFDFIVGADGVKILCPKVNEKWAYYMMVYISLHIENKGYSRHFGQIIKYCYLIPPLAEQQRIVQKIEELFSVLDGIQKALEV